MPPPVVEPRANAQEVTHYHKNEKGKQFPLQDVEIALLQIAILVYPISDIMKESQALHQWPASKTFYTSRLKAGLLNSDVSLNISIKASR